MGFQGSMEPFHCTKDSLYWKELTKKKTNSVFKTGSLRNRKWFFYGIPVKSLYFQE